MTESNVSSSGYPNITSISNMALVNENGGTGGTVIMEAVQLTIDNKSLI